MSSSAISEIAGGRLFFKCENFQKTGSFKFRGATNAVLSLQDGSADKGVATHSSGNHAAALAKAASDRGLESFIVMPESSPQIR
jgi:threonine dehydratase